MEPENKRCSYLDDNGAQCPLPGLCADKFLDHWVPYCAHHGGTKMVADYKKTLTKSMLTNHWKARIQRIGAAPEAKSLRDEIGTLKMSLDIILAQCKNEKDIFTHIGIIGDLVIKIEKIIASCHKMEVNLGNVLDRTALLQFGAGVISIISNYVEDSAAMQAISKEILELASNIQDDDT